MTTQSGPRSRGDARDMRLAAALKENLKRRKEQGRKRAAQHSGERESAPEETISINPAFEATTNGSLPDPEQSQHAEEIENQTENAARRR